MGYSALNTGEMDEGDRCALAAFVLSLNTLNYLRDKGVVDQDYYVKNIENMVAVSEPKPGTSLFRMAYQYLPRDRQEFQLNRQGIVLSELDSVYK